MTSWQKTFDKSQNLVSDSLDNTALNQGCVTDKSDFDHFWIFQIIVLKRTSSVPTSSTFSRSIKIQMFKNRLKFKLLKVVKLII